MLLLPIFIAAMNDPYQTKASRSLLALGDSYTIGEMVPDIMNFPNQLQRILNERGFAFAAPRIIAKTGWTTGELQDAIAKENITNHYDFVTLLIGVNNQYRGQDTAAYATGFESLLRQAIGFAGRQAAHVIVLSIPDWGVTPFAAGSGRDTRQISREIDAYNDINKRITSAYQVNYIDITPDTRLAADDPSLLATDGLHPSGKAYGRWAAEVAAVIEKKL